LEQLQGPVRLLLERGVTVTTNQEPELIQTRIPADVSRWVKHAADSQSLSVAAWLRAHLTKLATSPKRTSTLEGTVAERLSTVGKVRQFATHLRKKPAKIDLAQLATVFDSIAQTLEEDVKLLRSFDP
jgi:hypothetical protein